MKIDFTKDEIDFIKDAIYAWKNEGYYDVCENLDSKIIGKKFIELEKSVKNKLGE